MTVDLDRTINEMRSYLDENRDKYNAINSKINEPGFSKQVLINVHNWLSDVMSYDPTKGGQEATAAFIIGRTQVRFVPLLVDIEFQAQYEEELVRFNEAVRELEQQAEQERKPDPNYADPIS